MDRITKCYPNETNEIEKGRKNANHTLLCASALHKLIIVLYSKIHIFKLRCARGSIFVFLLTLFIHFFLFAPIVYQFSAIWTIKKSCFPIYGIFPRLFLLLCSISLTMSVKMSIKETTGWHWLFFFQIIRLKFPNKLFTRETFRVNYSYFTPHSQANIDLTRFILWLSYLLLLLLYEIHCHIINDKLTFVS